MAAVRKKRYRRHTSHLFQHPWWERWDIQTSKLTFPNNKTEKRCTCQWTHLYNRSQRQRWKTAPHGSPPTPGVTLITTVTARLGKGWGEGRRYKAVITRRETGEALRDRCWCNTVLITGRGACGGGWRVGLGGGGGWWGEERSVGRLSNIS